MMRHLLFLLAFISASAQASTRVENAMAGLVCASSDIGVAKIKRFVGYTDDGKMVLKGPFEASPAPGGGAIAVQFSIESMLMGSTLQPKDEMEIRFDRLNHEELSAMQEMFDGSATIVFYTRTPQGMRPVFDGLTSMSDLPVVKKIIAERAATCLLLASQPRGWEAVKRLHRQEQPSE